MKDKVSQHDEKTSTTGKTSLLGKMLQAIGKSPSPEKSSAAEKVSSVDTKPPSLEKISSAEKVSPVGAKPVTMNFSNVDTTPASTGKNLQSVGTFSSPENIFTADTKVSPSEKVSTVDMKIPPSEKVSTVDTKVPTPAKVSTVDTKVPTPAKVSTVDKKVPTPDKKNSPSEKISTVDKKTSSAEKISTVDKKTSSAEKASTSDKVEQYTITIKGGPRDRVIKLSSKMFRLGTASIIVGGMLLLATSAWSFYSALRMQRDAATIREVTQAAELRQEQLLTLSKKAATLDETIQNLTRQEEELRIQAGLNPIKDEPETSAETPPAEQNQATPETPPTETPASTETPAETSADDEHDGQGGPVAELDIADVSESLDMLEAKVERRRKSLDEFQAELKQRREQMAAGARVASVYTPGSPTPAVPGGGVEYDFSSGLPIIPAAGSIPAPGSFPFDPSLVGGNGAADSHIPSIWPTTGVVSSPYGLRWGGTDFHPGIDIANDMGTPIVATADGVVEYAGWNSGGYGNMVDIDHGNGIMTRYGHATQVVVSTGQHVKRGQLIAYMGSTGFSTGPHCHYEVHVNGNRVNPISYL